MGVGPARVVDPVHVGDVGCGFIVAQDLEAVGVVFDVFVESGHGEASSVVK